ncbi:MAG: hypothetical protein OEL87_01910 [Nanoarchaeota archaeon]|nr:hypothetical protein [Nanoarchaeota archaeon]
MKKAIFILVGLFVINMLSSASALGLVVHVPEKYTDVTAGERFYFEIDIKYPENPSRKDLRLEYEILTRDGELLSRSKTLKAVETQASFIDFIVIPEGAKNGLHIINVKVKDFEVLSEEASSSFNIHASSDTVTLYLVIILIAIIFVGILVILGIVLRKGGNH